MRRARGFILCGLLVALAGCAATGYESVSPTMPAAKAGLQPEYRIFYDALDEYGDWTLIEPYGYVFRPRVSFVAWQPYQEGFWVPSDTWGWVWISSEPFGWATYHYGRWMFDNFEGWVWIPGLDWGPAWVSWQIADNYAGWAPLGPRGANLGAPGGGYSYVPLGQLAATNLKGQIVSASQIAPQAAEAKPINNTVVKAGVTINRGPRFDMVERASGPLARVKLAEVSPGAPKKSATAGAAPAAPTMSIEDQIAATRRAAEDATRQARTVTETGGPSPARLSVVRPLLMAAPADRNAPENRAPARKTAAPDTTR